MNEYLARNWQRVKRLLLELEDLGLEQRHARILAIQDPQLRLHLRTCHESSGGEQLERPLARWVHPSLPLD